MWATSVSVHKGTHIFRCTKKQVVVDSLNYDLLLLEIFNYRSTNDEHISPDQAAAFMCDDKSFANSVVHIGLFHLFFISFSFLF